MTNIFIRSVSLRRRSPRAHHDPGHLPGLANPGKVCLVLLLIATVGLPGASSRAQTSEAGGSADPIGRTRKSIVIDRGCGQVWPVLLDFGGIAKWYKSFSWSRSVAGRPGEVGDVREFARAGNGQTVKEKLIYLDREGMELAYTHISNPPVRDSLAIVSLTSLAQNNCLVTWSNTYRLKPGQNAEETAGFFRRAYANVLTGLKQYLEGVAP
jgi:hypothetical protein